MCANFSNTFTSGDIGESECMVGSDCVKDLRGERPLEVENGRFGMTLEETVV